jgi:sulfonate transport system substrate-binding protein
MNGGSVDFGITGETPPIFAQAAAGSVVRYVAFEPPSPAGEAIVVPNDSSIRSVADLKGKTVAVARGSNSQYLLVRALENAGLRFSDIKVSYLTPADANAAFVQHSIDAWSIWDYYFAAAQARSGARVLVNGSDGLAYNHAFFLASQPFLSKYPNVISIALEEVAKVDAWTKANPAAAARLLSKSLGLPPDILEIALKRAGFGPATLTPDVIAAQQRIADTVYNIGLIPDHFNVADTVWNKPLVQTASH